MQMLTSSLKSLVYEKKKSLVVIGLVAFATIVALLSISIVMSFVVKTFGELEGFSPILRLYTTETAGASYTLVKVVNVVALTLSGVAVCGTFLWRTLEMRKSFVNYSLMGASFSQIAIIAWIKNITLLLVGVLMGALVAFGVAHLIGAVTSTAIIFAFDNVLICFLIYFAFTSILSVVIPLWS